VHAQENLAPGETVEVPLYLAMELMDRNVAGVKLPAYLGARARINALADAAGVDLRSASPYYFEVGATVAPAIRTASRTELVPALKSVLCQRYLKIMDVACNSHEQDESDFTDRLTVVERRAFAAGFDRAREVLRWKQRGLARVESVRPEAKRVRRFVA